MFDGDDLFGTATTLTESSLNIGISAEDVRGGEGAGLLGRYFHTSTFELTLTDALFNMEYIARSVGADMQVGGDVMANESHDLAASETTITLKNTPVPMSGCGDIYVWYRKSTEDEWTAAKLATGAKTITVNASTVATTYCVKYFYKNEDAARIRIDANYVPATLHLVLKENLYAAGETNNSQTKVGYVLINIPRFQLDGSQELSMSMTGASTTSLKGMALISDGCAAGCDGAGYYADMVQVIDSAKWFDGIMSIAVDGGKVKVAADGAVDVDNNRVYAIYKNKTPKLITKDMLTFKRGEDTITLTLKAENNKIELAEGSDVKASGTVVVEAASAE